MLIRTKIGDSVREFKKIVDEFGEVIGFETETHYFPPQKVKVDWCHRDGTRIDETFEGYVQSNLFVVHVPGIDSTCIESVEYPKLNYETSEDYLVKVVCRIFEED